MGELLKRDTLPRREGGGVETGSQTLKIPSPIFLGFLPLAPFLLRSNKHCCVISPFISLLPPLFPRAPNPFPLPLPRAHLKI